MMRRTETINEDVFDRSSVSSAVGSFFDDSRDEVRAHRKTAVEIVPGVDKISVNSSTTNDRSFDTQTPHHTSEITPIMYLAIALSKLEVLRITLCFLMAHAKTLS